MRSLLPRILGQRVLVLDGAMGTMVHAFPLEVDRDYLGCENCTEILVLSRPDVVTSIHDAYLAAGADAVETNTFGANQLVLAEFGLEARTREINRLAAELARAACDRQATRDRPRFVFGSMGPGTRLITLGQTDFASMLASYAEQARGLLDGGADAFLIETSQDLLQVKCAVCACLDVLRERNLDPADVPIMVQVTIETTGTMLLGTEIAAAAAALRPFPIASLGLNCATGPAEMAGHVRWLGRHWDRPVSVVPNAGLPALVDGRTEYPLAPAPFASKMREFVDTCGVTVVGGCCGTTPAHIAALVECVGDRPTVRIDRAPQPPACTSLYAPVEFRQDASTLNIGERTNASGSRLFKRLLEEEKWDEIVTLARDMTREGSHVIDINVDYAGRDNPRDMGDIVARIVRQVNVPIMLDSTQPATIEAGLVRAGGRCIINSANLEEGEERFAVMCGLARRYGAALVLGCIDEDPEEAMARTAARKLEIAVRMHDLAVHRHGLRPEDLFFDPLVLPVSTGMEKDRRSALETIEGTRLIAARFPECQVTCGLSNVSFGLSPAARVVLNSAFLNELVAAGLTSAILHVSKILPASRIDPERWARALDLLYDRAPAEPVVLRDGSVVTDPLQVFIDLFAGAESESASGRPTLSASLPLPERLRRHIIDGEKRDLTATLDEALDRWPALEIINDHLLDGMRTVGELFGAGRMQLPFVLQSAEVMKMAVGHLEPHMERREGSTRGSIVLATVKGDVHDIGKNLVDIILSNNGFRVHNLGIKQPSSAIIAALRETGADAIGLSGLLVKSVNVMEENLREFASEGLAVPVLLGGAALSRHYCDSALRPLYAPGVYFGGDAFEGLRLMEAISSGGRERLETEIEARIESRSAALERTRAVRERVAAGRATATASRVRSEIRPVDAPPRPPFLGTRLVSAIDLAQVYPFINRIALYRGQWQFRKGSLDEDAYARLLEEKADPVFARLCDSCRDQGILQPQVVYGWFPCYSEGDDLVVCDPADPAQPVERFTFPRQKGGRHLCISDFFRGDEPGPDGPIRDVLGMQCVTVGPRATEVARSLFESGDFTEYLFLHGLAVETAEALAELWHKRMRAELGIGNADAPDIRRLFTQQYQGSRYSFGYPACPDMQDQEKLFRLLAPDRIGCSLTENWQIDPEQSTSAIVVHHPDARYFSV